MTATDAPILDGRLVRLRPPQPGDAERRAELGRNREISRGFGADLETDEPMSLADAQLEEGSFQRMAVMNSIGNNTAAMVGCRWGSIKPGQIKQSENRSSI